MTPTGRCIGVLTALLLGVTAGAAPPRISLLDLEGRSFEPLHNIDGKAVVFIFVRSDCPISNRYAPELSRLHTRFAPHGVTFYLAYPDPQESPDTIRAHVREYGYRCTALRDPEHRLVELTQARVTPEAAVFTQEGRLAYLGRIDDWYVDFGKPRAAPTTHDLEDALEAVVSGRPVPHARTTAIGCFIGDLK